MSWNWWRGQKTGKWKIRLAGGIGFWEFFRGFQLNLGGWLYDEVAHQTVVIGMINIKLVFKKKDENNRTAKIATSFGLRVANLDGASFSPDF